MRTWILASLLLLPALPVAANVGSRTPAPAVSQKHSSGAAVDGTVDGFSALLLITPDADWKAKWETPSDTIPRFATTQEVRRGGKVFILTFFANAKVDATGHANISCDLDVVRPDGSYSQHETGLPCFQGPYETGRSLLVLTGLIVQFSGDPGDPAGKWLVRVRMHDDLRHATVPLDTWFELKD